MSTISHVPFTINDNATDFFFTRVHGRKFVEEMIKITDAVRDKSWIPESYGRKDWEKLEEKQKLKVLKRWGELPEDKKNGIITAVNCLLSVKAAIASQGHNTHSSKNDNAGLYHCLLPDTAQSDLSLGSTTTAVAHARASTVRNHSIDKDTTNGKRSAPACDDGGPEKRVTIAIDNASSGEAISTSAEYLKRKERSDFALQIINTTLPGEEGNILKGRAYNMLMNQMSQYEAEAATSASCSSSSIPRTLVCRTPPASSTSVGHRDSELEVTRDDQSKDDQTKDERSNYNNCEEIDEDDTNRHTTSCIDGSGTV